jgi:hypothetical protein
MGFQASMWEYICECWDLFFHNFRNVFDSWEIHLAHIYFHALAFVVSPKLTLQHKLCYKMIK